jgi:predicted RND superfamily exporter protein
MAVLRNVLLMLLFLFGSLMLTGCLNRQSPAEEMYEVLENVVQIEKAFEEQQEPLVVLEKEEKDLYAQIIELNIQENHKEIVNLSNSAIEIAEKRQNHLDKERKSIEESKLEFEPVAGVIEKIDEEDLKTKATSLYDLMQERYAIHEKLYQSYTEGLSNDINLYNMLKQEEEIESERIEEQLNKVNEAYEEVLIYNQDFNEKTDRYNEAKLDFYHSAGLNIQPSEE